MRSHGYGALLAAGLCVACGDDGNGGTTAGGGGGGSGGQGGAPVSGWSRAPDLPEPAANNAVAATMDANGGCVLLSAYGIAAPLTAAAIHRRGFVWREGEQGWAAIADVPVAQGRIAASAVGLRGKFYVLGGYSVATNGSETTYDDVLVYDPQTNAWSNAAPLPVGVDDAAAVAWRDRYIVVTSGWSDAQQPVADVQVYDVEDDSWTMGTPFPGTPVFGHAAAIEGDELVLIDGTGQVGSAFGLIDQAWRATLNPAAPSVMTWSDLGGHPAPGRYRAAATSMAGVLLFHGGTAVPYNFDGLAYANGQPAPPLNTTLGYAISSGEFGAALSAKPNATMDHRGMPTCGQRAYTVGGMLAGPMVTDQVWRYAQP